MTISDRYDDPFPFPPRAPPSPNPDAHDPGATLLNDEPGCDHDGVGILCPPCAKRLDATRKPWK